MPINPVRPNCQLYKRHRCLIRESEVLDCPQRCNKAIKDLPRSSRHHHHARRPQTQPHVLSLPESASSVRCTTQSRRRVRPACQPLVHRATLIFFSGENGVLGCTTSRKRKPGAGSRSNTGGGTGCCGMREACLKSFKVRVNVS